MGVGVIQFFKKSYVESFKGLNKEVWYLAGVLLVNRAGAMVLPFLALYFSQELEWTPTRVAIGGLSFGLGSLAGSMLGGFLSDRIGPYRVMLYSLILGGICFMNMIWFTDFYMLCIWIFITTTIADCSRPAAFSAIADYSNDDNVTRGISLIRIAINLGLSIGPAVAGLLIAIYSYFWLFIIDGITCVLAGFVLIRLLSHTKDNHKVDDHKEENEQKLWHDLPFISFLFFNILIIAAFLQIVNATPYFFKLFLSLSEMEIGLFFTINGLLIVVFEMPIIFWLEKINKPFRPLFIGALMMAASYLVFAFDMTPLVVILIHLLLITFGEMVNFPYISTIAIKRAGPAAKGSYLGAVSMMFSVAFILSPLLGIPMLESLGKEIYWTSVFIVMLISTAGFFISKKWMKM